MSAECPGEQLQGTPHPTSLSTSTAPYATGTRRGCSALDLWTKHHQKESRGGQGIPAPTAHELASSHSDHLAHLAAVGLDPPSVDAAEEFADTDGVIDALFAARAAIDKALDALGVEEESDTEDVDEDADFVNVKASKRE